MVGSLFLWFAFFDEQHRDSVDDRIEDLAVRAPEVVRLLQLQLGVALGASQNLEQLWRDHACIVLREGASRESAAARQLAPWTPKRA